MTVDPSDSSYMPSVVVISAGDSIQSLKEVKTVHISATDSLCTLLEDAQEVCGFRVFVPNHSYEYDFHLQVQFCTNQTHEVFARTRFETETQDNSEMAYFHVIFHVTI